MQATHKRTPIADRLFAKLAQREDGCIEFVGARMPRGYGVINLGGWHGGNTTAHRVAWELVNGPIPTGMDICHRCDNPPCCNVEHLFLGTRLDNVRDMWSKGRASPPPRHRGETHPQASESDEFVQRCRDEHAGGSNAKQIADKYGIPHSTVWGWVTGRSRTKDSA